MSASNRTRPADLDFMTTGDLKELPLADIAMVLEDVKDIEALTKTRKAKLQTELKRRLSAIDRDTRQAAGKLFGKVSFGAEGCNVVADRPAEYKWDQAELDRVAGVIAHDWGDSVADYMTLTYKVSATAYKAWPNTIKSLFQPALTVEPGTVTYTITPEDAA